MSNKSNKKILIIAIVIAVVLIVGIGSLVFLDNGSKDYDLDEKYTFRYYYNNQEFDIVFGDSKIYVTTYDQVVCIKAPCNPIYSGKKDMKLTKEYDYLISYLFPDKQGKSVTYDELDEESRKLVHKIIGVEIEKNIEYKILESNDYAEYDKRGYYIEKQMDSIALGQKNTGGYGLIISKVNIYDDNKVTIYLEEIMPNEKETVTQAITYPAVQIVFSEDVEIEKVINLDSGATFEEVKK